MTALDAWAARLPEINERLAEVSEAVGFACEAWAKYEAGRVPTNSVAVSSKLVEEE